MTKRSAAKDPTRNVWLQLGFPDAEDHYLKAELVVRLARAIRALGLTQRAAARRLGTTQPELSKILGGKFTEVSSSASCGSSLRWAIRSKSKSAPQDAVRPVRSP